jgi:deoxyribose-phosphate aldolase
MSKEITNRIVDQVFKERSLYRKICGSGPECTHCGLCLVKNPEGVRNIIKSGAERITAGLGMQENELNMNNIAGMIDHTLLKPDATNDQIRVICDEARKYSFASVCVNSCWVKECYEMLKGTKVKVCTVIGFPLGAASTEAKVAETKQAILDGALEIDMVINIGKLKSGDKNYVYNDINQISMVCKKNNALLKVILETCLLTDEEKITACLIAKEAKADFVKTSTGFSNAGATAGDVALMKKVVGSTIGVKASGGIRTYEDVVSMIKSGADRIGASASVKIVTSINN